MIPKKNDLGDRLTLRVCETDKFKSGMLSISAVLPIEPRRVWMTVLALSVLRRGTRKYPSLAALNRRLDYLYGSELAIRNLYRGDCHVIGFTVEFLRSDALPDGESLLGDVLDVVREILFEPLLDADGLLDARYVESEKKTHCDSIRALKNNPRSYAMERCQSILYENEPCGVDSMGREEDVMALTPQELTAHWRSLIESLTLDCFYVGEESADRIADALKSCFLPYLGGKAAERCPTQPTIVRRAEEIRRAEESLPVGQSHLLLGLRTGVWAKDPSYYACALYNELLGGSPISRLFVHVREKRSLCYFCSSRYNAYKGTLLIHCGLDRDSREAAEEEILAQMRALADGDFEDVELDAAKRSLVNAYRQMEDSPAALENFYYGRSLIGVDVSMSAFREAFQRVTREEIVALAKGITVDTVYVLNGTLAHADGEEVDCDEDD